MHKSLFFLFSILTGVFVSCTPSSRSAKEYNDRIIGIINVATLAQNNFFDQTDGHHMDSLVIRRKHYEEASQKCVEDIASVKDFEGSKEYKLSAEIYLTTLHSLALNEAKEMVNIMSKRKDEINESDVAKVEQLVNKIDVETKIVSNSFEKAQKEFSEKWKFKVDD